jgi:CheY-like chemotaxis protein
MQEKARILVVDDEPLNVELLKAILEPNHYDVITAASGIEALSVLAKQKIDLVLLDVMMPVIDGFEVTRKIRSMERLRNLPVILVTALHETSEKIAGIEAGCDEFVTKPFDKQEVLARIKTLLRLTYYRTQLDEKEKFEHLIHRMNDGLIVCDAEMRIIRSNQQGRSLLGSEDQSAGWLEHLTRTFKVGHYGDLKQDLGRMNLEFDLERPETPTAAPLILSFSSSVIKDTDGKMVSAVIILHDVTLQRKEQFEKSEFLRLMSYKLRSPLAEGLEELHELQKATATLANKSLQESVEVTVGKISEFLRMIEKIFDYLAIQASLRYGGKSAGKQVLDMGQVEALVKAAFKGPQGKKAECKFKLPAGLGLPISAALLEITLKNLIENALKFNDQETAKLLFTAALDGGKVRFTVSDNGPGIPSEERHNVFQAFYQIDKHGTGAVRGMGLGLAIVKKIVESEEGEIRVDHQTGGASISFSLPLAAA